MLLIQPVDKTVIHVTTGGDSIIGVNYYASKKIFALKPTQDGPISIICI